MMFFSDINCVMTSWEVALKHFSTGGVALNAPVALIFVRNVKNIYLTKMISQYGLEIFFPRLRVVYFFKNHNPLLRFPYSFSYVTINFRSTEDLLSCTVSQPFNAQSFEFSDSTQKSQIVLIMLNAFLSQI